jgi:16S rRNA (cytosine1402-N4)-methyltransferase
MPKQKPKIDQAHSPVLVKEVLRFLNPKRGDSYLDLTAGYGGHASAVIEVTDTPKKATLTDRDENAIAALHARFKGAGVQIIKSDFLSTIEKLASEGKRFDMILADLGVSSPHLEDAKRGFSFQNTGPLDMRMDQSQDYSADRIVNHTDEAELTEILKKYGEEPKAKSIARTIIQNRPIEDTRQLAALIAQASGIKSRFGRINPATKSFQAIRIAVNDELGQLERALPLMMDLLAPGGRFVVISFHSLEDRLVKRFLKEHAGNTYDAELRQLTKKPVTASRDEIVSNPRARSAKLRAAAK